MATITPAGLVQGAARIPLPFGVFSVVSFRPEESARWQGGGVVWEYIDPFTVDSFGPAQVPQDSTIGLPLNLDFPENESGVSDAGFTTGLGFSVYGHFVVSPVAWTPETAEARALDVLYQFEERQVEHNFWTGTNGNTPNLENPSALGSYTLDQSHFALGELENFLATTYGSQGVMHMSRKLALGLLHNGTLKVVGNKLTTALGTPVIAGSGYEDGEIRATPALFGYRGTPFTSSDRRGDLLDKSNNNLYAVAERSYLLGFDPTGVGSVLITS